ncbi:MAG: DNA-binding response regulator [Opitutales bacterium]|nr:DNA-binding response regulator [Opitutales bacterium]
MTSPSDKPKILIIDDDSEIRYSLYRALSDDRYEILTAASGENGIEVAKEAQPNVVFLDNRMGGMTGLETLQHLRSISPHSMVILMTAFGTTQTAIEAMKHGAFDYVLKPFDLNKLRAILEKALKAGEDSREAGGASERLLNTEDYKEGIVGSGEKMQEVLKTVGQVAVSDVTVMITGESGTGKELIARCIHRHGYRSDKTFIPVNCAAIPENLIESELFGHEKGSFTGATESKPGKFELCNGGTIFLDEVGDMSLSTQTKILRAIQEGEVQRVGGTKVKRVDVRVIAATNKNLESMVKASEFREDLYYRLNVVRIQLPALRERMEDLPELVDFMIQRLSQAGKTRVTEISRDVLAVLMGYDWPGNVRELENVMQSSSVVAQGRRILVKDLPDKLRDAPARVKKKPAKRPAGQTETAISSQATVAEKAPSSTVMLGDRVEPLEQTPRVSAQDAGGVSIKEIFDLAFACVREKNDKNLLQVVEREVIERCLKETGGNQVKASKLLGITRATLRKRIDTYSIRY